MYKTVQLKILYNLMVWGYDMKPITSSKDLAVGFSGATKPSIKP